MAQTSRAVLEPAFTRQDFPEKAGKFVLIKLASRSETSLGLQGVLHLGVALVTGIARVTYMSIKATTRRTNVQCEFA